MPKDNAGFIRKRQIRVNLLREIQGTPLVLETHAGAGKLYRHCYLDVPFGVAIDRSSEKASLLAHQRPTWAVYEADSERALREGLGARWAVNFVDVDPWGDPWPTLAAFFESTREIAPRLVVCVTDGLRQSAKMGISWKVGSLKGQVERRGNAAIHSDYLGVCEELLGELARRAGFKLARWTGYYTGHAQQMTHYGAVLTR